MITMEKMNINAVDLFTAISLGDANSVKILIDRGIDVIIDNPIDAKNPWEISPLRQAIVDEQYEIVRLLLDAGADPNKDWSLLMAAHEGYTNVVPLLLEYGANPNIRDDEGSVPLKEAVWNGDLVSTKALVDAGADIEYYGGVDGFTILGAAAIDGHIEIVRLLLKIGVNIDARDSDSRTVLELMTRSLRQEDDSLDIKKRREEIIKLLQQEA